MLITRADLMEKLTVFICCMMVTGLFFASGSSDINTELPAHIAEIPWLHTPLIISISMILFLILPFITYKPSLILSNYFKRKEFFLLSLIFVYLFTGFLNAETYSYLFQRLQIKLPFLILPLAAASLPISKKGFHIILFTFLSWCFIIALYTFIHYIRNYELITLGYIHSKVMPTPMNHVRFSILLALAVYTSYYLIKNNVSLFTYNKVLIIISGLFLFVFIHLYSVRSGLLSLYGILFIEIVLLVTRKKAYKSAILALSGIIIIGAASIYFSPTLQNKLSNTQQDLSIIKNKGNANYNSLSTRIISYKIAIQLFNENRLTGCGLGNLEAENLKIFKQQYPEISIPIIPHNEFLYYLAAMGILGVIAFTICFFFPLFYKKNYLNEFLLMHYVVLFLSFQSEPMIETQLGVACTILFIIFPLMSPKETVAQEA